MVGIDRKLAVWTMILYLLSLVRARAIPSVCQCCYVYMLGFFRREDKGMGTSWRVFNHCLGPRLLFDSCGQRTPTL